MTGFNECLRDEMLREGKSKSSSIKRPQLEEVQAEVGVQV